MIALWKKGSASEKEKEEEKASPRKQKTVSDHRSFETGPSAETSGMRQKNFDKQIVLRRSRGAISDI